MCRGCRLNSGRARPAAGVSASWCTGGRAASRRGAPVVCSAGGRLQVPWSAEAEERISDARPLVVHGPSGPIRGFRSTLDAPA